MEHKNSQKNNMSTEKHGKNPIGSAMVVGSGIAGMQSALDLAQQVRGRPLSAIIYTDISKDGMLVGPNLQATEELALSTSVPVIAAGGVTTEADVRALAQLPLAGIIIGRALYEGRITIPQALKIVHKHSST